MKRVHIIISGRVQGVFFRYNTKKIANELGLGGFVRNLPDGTVEIVAEGEEEKINKLIDFCKIGPRAAEVIGIKIEYEEPRNEFSNFEIGY